MFIGRYADDLMAGFQHHEDTQLYRKELGGQLRDFGIEMNEKKFR